MPTTVASLAPDATEFDASLWDALPGWVLLLNRQGRALYVNPSLCAFGARTRPQLRRQR